MELLGDLLTLFLLGAAVWVFLPAAVRGALRAALVPATLTLGSLIRSAAPTVGRAMTWLIVGRVSRVSPIGESEPRFTPPPPSLTEAAEPAERTNEPGRSVLIQAAERLQLDRSRSALIAVLVEAGWKTTDIRDVLKGTAADLGDEIRLARAQLAESADLLIVRDGADERVILK